MNHQISVVEYLTSGRTQEEMQSLLYGMDREARSLYQRFMAPSYFNIANGAFLSRILSRVMVDATNPTQVIYLDCHAVDKYDRPREKESTIEFLTVLALGLYVGYGIDHGLFSKQVLEQNFDAIRYLLPTEDIPYYEMVLLQKQYSFYSDFIDQKQQMKMSQEATGEASTNGRSLQYVKQGPHSLDVEAMSAPTPEEIVSANGNRSAFAQSIFLFFLFGSVILAMVLFAVLLVS